MIFNQRRTFWKDFIKMTVKRLARRRINATLIKKIDPRIWYMYFKRTKLSEYIIILFVILIVVLQTFLMI